MRDTGMSLELFIYLEQTNDWFQMKSKNKMHFMVSANG